MYLNCHSYYSFKYGTLSPTDLLDEAEKHGVRQLALTDINSTSGSLYYAMEAQKRGINVVLGVDFRNGAKQQYVALARSNNGFQHINSYLSKLLKTKEDIPSEAPYMDEVFIIYPLENAPDRTLAAHEYIGVSLPEMIAWNLRYKRKWTQEKCVALHTVSFRNKRDFNAHRLLRAIDNNLLLSRLSTNEYGILNHRFYQPDEVEQAYSGYSFLIKNAQSLLDRCTASFEFNLKGTTQNKERFTKSEEEDYQLLHTLAQEGLSYRFGNNITPEILQRLEKELRVIQQCNFVPYFLINHSIVQYARSKGYFYVGRGSGSNSLVAYLLKITNVNPIELDLYFERFINPNRKSPPDFDVDFSWKDRNDVTQFIFNTYENTALLGSFVTFQQRSVLREIGKVLGLPGAEIKALQRVEHIKDLDQIARLTYQYSHYIHGLPNYLSIHSSGIVITEKPITYFGATSLPPKGFPTTHFDMHIAEDVGIHKYDILGQRGLGKIKDALEVIRVNNPNDPPIDIDDVERFKKDEKVKDILRTARSIGCFYVESPAMRGLMKKLEVDDYKGLVAASSIIRPGVSHSGMMQEYIKRHRNPAARAATHPVLGEILNETYGVMVYQEDVLKVAHYFAGLTLEESDKLRRGMSWKFRERPEFMEVKDKFYSNCEKKNYPIELTTEIWRQIESFANYAFAKGHSASYAVESYQSLYLKAYYPLEYMVATINNFGGFYSTEHYLQEARLHGATVTSPCVNRANYLTRIEGKTIILGFQHIKNLDSSITSDFLANRQNYGVFRDLEDFINRIPISLEMLIVLIRSNAFAFTKKEKTWLLWKAHFILGGDKKKVQNHASLFDFTATKKVEIPTLSPMLNEDSYDEIENFGFPLCSPFELIDQEELQGSICSSSFAQHEGKSVKIVGYLVHRKRTTTRGKVSQEMMFGTLMDREGNFFDSVHFPNSMKYYKFKGKGIYTLFGRITSDHEHYTIEVHKMKQIMYTKLLVEA
ncbi:MAG: DNA polymerase III subunit alpha [Bacteroidia bacterium]|nr:DNA polymerase III subunit alpha [Bacteroidia bacterium]